MPLFIASTALIGHAANVICGAQLRARADPWTAHEALRPDARPIEVLRALVQTPAEIFSDFWFLKRILNIKHGQLLNIELQVTSMQTETRVFWPYTPPDPGRIIRTRFICVQVCV